MSDSIIHRFVPKHDSSAANRNEDEIEQEDFECFGRLRGVRERALMLELRLKTGNIVSFGYPWLERIDYDPSFGIQLSFGRKQVRIVGVHLNSEVRGGVSLFTGLVRHRVPWIAEMNSAASLLASNTALVSEILFS